MVPRNGLLDESLVVGFAAADLFDFDDLSDRVSVNGLSTLRSASGYGMMLVNGIDLHPCVCQSC